VPISRQKNERDAYFFFFKQPFLILLLKALNFDLDGKLSLGDLTMALENELLVTKNGIHQAALASFKAEIRCLL